MSLLDKIKKNSTIKDSAILAKSKFFTAKDMIPTAIRSEEHTSELQSH